MDDVYKFYNNNASSKIQIKEYFDEYLKMIRYADCFMSMKKDTADIISLMGVELEEEEMSMLMNYCRYYLVQIILILFLII